jgi:hypothetical protein
MEQFLFVKWGVLSSPFVYSGIGGHNFDFSFQFCLWQSRTRLATKGLPRRVFVYYFTFTPEADLFTFTHIVEIINLFGPTFFALELNAAEIYSRTLKTKSKSYAYTLSLSAD